MSPTKAGPGTQGNVLHSSIRLKNIAASAYAASVAALNLYQSRGWVALLLGAVALSAPAAWATFTVQSDATVVDPATGLMWDRCTWGATGADCSGSAATTHTWAQALAVAQQANAAVHKGYTDWRLPNRSELESLVHLMAQNPAIDVAVFPHTPAQRFWSATTYAGSPALGWYSNFSDGNTLAATKAATYNVRLVRSGRAVAVFDLVDTNAPSTTAGPTVTPGANGTTATARVTVSETGTGYWQVLPAGQAAPTVAVLLSGGTPINLTAGQTATIPIGGLLANTAYALHFIAKDGAGNAQASVVSVGFTTLGGPIDTSSLPLPGGGTAQVTVAGGACFFTQAGFVPSSSVSTPPQALVFAAGLFEFTLDGCATGATATISITYPMALSTHARYWKYGPTAGHPTPDWYLFPGAVISGNTVTLTITDGALGDSDLAANGRISDPGGPAVGSEVVAPIPTLSSWGLLLLACLLLVPGFRALGGRRILRKV